MLDFLVENLLSPLPGTFSVRQMSQKLIAIPTVQPLKCYLNPITGTVFEVPPNKTEQTNIGTNKPNTH